MISHTMHCATTLCPWESVVAQPLCCTSSVDDQSHKALRDHSLPLGERGGADLSAVHHQRMIHWMISHNIIEHCATTLCPWERGRAASLLYLISG